MEQLTYKNLESFVNTDFKIVDGEPNIIGWSVKNETEAYVGEVKDLLYDTRSNSVRYLVVDLTDNGMNLDSKVVMIPIGIAHLHNSDNEVTLPNISQEQFKALPDYTLGGIDAGTEVTIREIIGSPAAIRIEENTLEFDQQQFYSHQHFDREYFYRRGGNQNNFGQQDTIHGMVTNSKENNHGADYDKDKHESEKNDQSKFLPEQ